MFAKCLLLDYVRSFPLQPYLLLSLLSLPVTLDLGTSLSGKQFADFVYLPRVPGLRASERASASVCLCNTYLIVVLSLLPLSLLRLGGRGGKKGGALSAQCGLAPIPPPPGRGGAVAPSLSLPLWSPCTSTTERSLKPGNCLTPSHLPPSPHYAKLILL